MACSCKKNVNPKYIDGEDAYKDLGLKHFKGVEKVGNVVLQFLFGILISLILIISLIPFVCYLIYGVCAGKPITIRIPNFYKWFKKE